MKFKQLLLDLQICLCTTSKIRNILYSDSYIYQKITKSINICDVIVVYFISPFQMLFRLRDILKMSRKTPLAITEHETTFRHNIQLRHAIVKITDMTCTFYRCYSLKNVLVIDTEHIPDECFSYNISLEKVMLSKHTKTIENKAFANCISLKTIFIPKTIEHISSYAFDNCISQQHRIIC